jgi:AcrR family transcriptional regulator
MAAKTTKTSAAAPARRARSDGERSRAAILHEAARLATVDGLDGLSLAHLANAVGMSKSGLFAHFRSKQELQLATVDAASAIFDEQVIEPAVAVRPGVARLRAYVERFLGHVEEGVFPGGCFFVSAVSELDSHPGPVRDGAMAFSQRWLGLLAAEVAAAQTRRRSPSSSTPTWSSATCSSSLPPIRPPSTAFAAPSRTASPRSRHTLKTSAGGRTDAPPECTCARAIVRPSI